MCDRSHLSTDSKLQRVVDEVDRTVCESDRRFFDANPDRNHRVRPASDVEISEMEMALDSVLSGGGTRWFVSVTRMSPGVRLRSFCEMPPETPWQDGFDLGEEICRSYAESAPEPLRALAEAVKKNER